MLHVTNGSIAVSRLHDLGLPGRIIAWDDVLHEGPVRAGLTIDELRHERAVFLGASWDDARAIEHQLQVRDRQLWAAAVGEDEVVLWFEHDLYDQLHVLQVLDQLAAVGAGRTAQVSAILADDYLAAQPDWQLRAWFDARRPVTGAQWEAASLAWRAFRAPDPTGLAAFAHPGAWPALVAGLRRHLQQFPSVGRGLSRTEVQTLRALDRGPLVLRDAFRAANADVEPAIFMGDLAWWYHVRPLLAGPRPILRVVGDPPADANHPEWWRDDGRAPALALTGDGALVLAGNADRVALNGIDRWLGGVHVSVPPAGASGTVDAIWRWDEALGTVRRA